MILFTFQMDNILRITRLFGADIFQGFDKERQNDNELTAYQYCLSNGF